MARSGCHTAASLISQTKGNRTWHRCSSLEGVWRLHCLHNYYRVVTLWFTGEKYRGVRSRFVVIPNFIWNSVKESDPCEVAWNQTALQTALLDKVATKSQWYGLKSYVDISDTTTSGLQTRLFTQCIDIMSDALTKQTSFGLIGFLGVVYDSWMNLSPSKLLPS